MRQAARFPITVWLATLAGAGCSLLRPAPQPIPMEPDSVAALPAEIAFPHPTVWTAFRDVAVRGDSLVTVVPRTLTALEVLRADSEGILVRCARCPREPVGWVLHREVLHTPLEPAVAAYGTLGEFALAVRDAAARGDTAALRHVMAPDFTFSFIGAQGVAQAIAGWASDDLSTLSRVPGLLDHGLVPGPGGIWAAPPEFMETLGYHGLRLGFRRTVNGVWEWLFLLRGEGPT